MSYTLPSKHDGTIEFRREPARNGGHVIAIFPADPTARDPRKRGALTVNDGYVELPPNYVRRLRHVVEDDNAGREQAETLLERIDMQADYARSPMVE